MSAHRFMKYSSVLIVALLVGIGLYMRTILPYDQIFSGDWIKFAGVDAYYHMRLVDNLVHNFPHLMTFDPYFLYPGGNELGPINFFAWLLAAVIWIIGLGAPSQHTIDIVGVYFPAVLGAVTVIPVYFIGRELFGRWVGLLAAAILVILPGEFLGRSVLGFTDYHVAEALFTTTTMMFLILAIKTAKQRHLAFTHLKNRDWAVITRPVIYSLLAGLWLGIYLITWSGALLFVFLITVFFVIQFIVDHLMHQSTDYISVVGGIMFFIVLLMPPLWSVRLEMISLVIVLVGLLALSGISTLMVSKGIKAIYYPLTLVVIAAVGLGIFYAAAPSLLNVMLSQFSIFTPSQVAQTTIEVQPLLFPDGKFSLAVAWSNYTTAIYISIIALGILIYSVIRKGDADKMLLVLWSLIILAATLGQRRFGYYLSVNVALLSGYLAGLIFKLAVFRQQTFKPPEIPPKPASKKTSPRNRQPRSLPVHRYINISLAAIAVFFSIFYFNLKPAMGTAQRAAFAPSDAWCESLDWLRNNTPDPAGDPNFYYQLYQSPPPGEQYEYPDAAYGVLSWWDYGYWITRIAHRLPNTNPGQPAVPIRTTCGIFLSQYEGAAYGGIRNLDSAYVVLDYSLTSVKLWAIATWGGLNQSQFYDVYYAPQDNKLVPVLLFYPAYYRSLSVRLFNFDAKEFTPQATIVISYENKVSREGQPYRQIITAESFTNWKEAVSYAASQKSGNYRIVSNDPFSSPVPLEALQDYRLIRSDGTVKYPWTSITTPEIKIFQYLGDRTKPPKPAEIN